MKENFLHLFYYYFIIGTYDEVLEELEKYKKINIVLLSKSSNQLSDSSDENEEENEEEEEENDEEVMRKKKHRMAVDLTPIALPF